MTSLTTAPPLPVPEPVTAIPSVSALLSAGPVFPWWKRWWRRLAASAFDEAVGLMVLHRILRYRRLPPVSGSLAASFPDLFSGEIERFARPVPEPVDLERSLRPLLANASMSVEQAAFPSTVRSMFPSSDVIRISRWRSLKKPSDLTVVGVDGIVQYGHGWFHRFAKELVPAGVELVMMDVPFNHRRTPDGFRPGQLIVGGDLEHQLSVSRQAILDLWTVIRSLQASGRRVGLVGLSYGGWLSLMTACVADGLEFVTALIPPVDMFRILQEGGTVVRAARRGLGRVTQTPDELHRISRAVSPIAWNPRLAGDRVTLHAARYDRFVPPHRIAELARHWNARLLVHEDGHMGVGVRREHKVQIARDIVERFAAGVPA